MPLKQVLKHRIAMRQVVVHGRRRDDDRGVWPVEIHGAAEEIEISPSQFGLLRPGMGELNRQGLVRAWRQQSARHRKDPQDVFAGVATQHLAACQAIPAHLDQA